MRPPSTCFRCVTHNACRTRGTLVIFVCCPCLVSVWCAHYALQPPSPHSAAAARRETPHIPPAARHKVDNQRTHQRPTIPPLCPSIRLCGLLSRRRVPWRTVAVSLVGEHQWTAAKGLVLGTHGSDPRKKTGSRASQRAKTQRGAVASMTMDGEGEDEQEQRHGGTILAAAVMELELAFNMRRQTQLYGTFPNTQGWPTHVLVPSLILVAARLVWPVLNSNPPAIAQNLDGSSEGDESDERPLADTADDDRPPRRRAHPSTNTACGRLMANMPENRELFHVRRGRGWLHTMGGWVDGVCGVMWCDVVMCADAFPHVSWGGLVAVAGRTLCGGQTRTLQTHAQHRHTD